MPEATAPADLVPLVVSNLSQAAKNESDPNMRVPCQPEQIKGNSGRRSFLLSCRTPIALAIFMAVFLHVIVPILRSSEDVLEEDELSSSGQAQHGGRTNNVTRRWCMLTKDTVPKKKGKWFGTIEHFPHTLEWYSDCWNWLQEQSDFEGASVEGGFIVDEFVKKKLQKKYWNRAFIPAIKFPVKIWTNETANEEHVDYSVISTKYYDGGWFQRDNTCDSFRQRLWKNLKVKTKKYSKKHIRIGILNRNESRAIVNVYNLARQLKSHYKGAKVDIRAFDSEYELKHEEDSLQEQARWFADKDLLILAHGAAMSNVVFMRPGTAVFEMFPRYYFNDMFWQLMSQCGIYHSWYYDGNMTKSYTQKIAQAETEVQWKHRMQHKKKNIAYQWKDVDHIIKQLLKTVDSQG